MGNYDDKSKMNGGRHKGRRHPRIQGQHGGNTQASATLRKPTVYKAPVNKALAVNASRVAHNRPANVFKANARAQNTLRAVRSAPQFRGQTVKAPTQVKYSLSKWFSGGKMSGGVTRRKRKISRNSRKHHKRG
jgi:hypothetical protein